MKIYMDIAGEILSYLEMELEGKRVNRTRVALHTSRLGRRDKKAVISATKKIIRSRIEEDRGLVTEIYRKWRDLERVLIRTLSFLNVEERNRKKRKKLPISKTIEKSILKKTRLKKEEVLLSAVDLAKRSLREIASRTLSGATEMSTSVAHMGCPPEPSSGSTHIHVSAGEFASRDVKDKEKHAKRRKIGTNPALCEGRSEEKKNQIDGDISKKRRAAPLVRSDLTEMLKIHVRLLDKIGEHESLKNKIVEVYCEHAQRSLESAAYASGHVKGQDIAMDNTSRKVVEERIETISKLPGIFVQDKGMSSRIRKKIRASVSEIVLDDRVLNGSDFLRLLEEKDARSLEKLFLLDFPKKERTLLIKKVREGVCAYTGKNPYRKTVEIKSAPWGANTEQSLRQILREELVKRVKEDPERHSGTLLLELFHLLTGQSKTKEEMQAIKAISKHVSDTQHFRDALCLFLMNAAMKRVPKKEIERSIAQISRKWKPDTRRRIEKTVQEYTAEEPFDPENAPFPRGAVSLVHVSSFRWPQSLETLDIKRLPDEITKLKKAVTAQKRKQRIKIDWLDSFSTVDIEIGHLTATLTLPQYWAIYALENSGSITKEDAKNALHAHSDHLDPLVQKNIVKIDNSSGLIEKGASFSDPEAWRELLPEYKHATEHPNTASKKHLTSMFVDSYISRTLKHRSTADKSALLAEIAKMCELPEELVVKRLEALVSKGLIKENGETLLYLP